MAMKPAPLDVILNASDALDGGQPWYCGEGRVNRNDIAQTVLSGVPDGWAKVDGEWVQLRRWQIPERMYEDMWMDQQEAICDWPILYSLSIPLGQQPTTLADPATGVSDSPQGQPGS